MKSYRFLLILVLLTAIMWSCAAGGRQEGREEEQREYISGTVEGVDYLVGEDGYYNGITVVRFADGRQIAFEYVSSFVFYIGKRNIIYYKCNNGCSCTCSYTTYYITEVAKDDY